MCLLALTTFCTSFYVRITVFLTKMDRKTCTISFTNPKSLKIFTLQNESLYVIKRLMSGRLSKMVRKRGKEPHHIL